MSICVIIDTFKSDHAIRKPENAIFLFRWCHTAYDVIMALQWRRVISAVISHYNPNKEIL